MLLLILALVLDDGEEALTQFPTPEYVADVLAFNQRYRGFLQLHLDACPTPELRTMQEEAYRLWWVWDCLAYAQRGELRRLLGEDNYRRGLMPPPVPLWRFSVMD